MQDRAYTRLEAGAARIGNRWCERVWSAFLGNSTELREVSGGFDWFDDPGEEFLIEAGGRTYGLMELGEISWSEECNPHAAALVAMRSNDDLAFITRTVVFHECPGFLRLSWVVNLRDRPLDITRVVSESLPLRRGTLRLASDAFRGACRAAVLRDAAPLAAVCLEGRGLLFGMVDQGSFELFDPAPDVCAAALRDAFVLAPGEQRALPATYIIPFEGALGDVAEGLLDRFERALDAMQQWEETVQREARAEPEPGAP